MADVHYLDCIEIKSPKNGACSIFYSDIDGEATINLTDAGYQSTFDDVSSHINEFYGPNVIFDNVIVTHNDNDHCGGIINILETYEVGNLWMLRPWKYANELIDRFSRYKSVENLETRLRDVYSNLAALEDIALEKGIPIHEPFQGMHIGKSLVLAPTKERFLDLIVESEKTPDAVKSFSSDGLFRGVFEGIECAINFIRSLWGEENFPSQGTSAENEMSVVQFISCPQHNFMLTGDAGREGLTEALDYLETLYGGVPQIDFFEVPHHGSRRNLSTELLDRLFGERLSEQPSESGSRFSAVVHSCRLDSTHPRKVVIRAIHHRGGKICSVESGWWLAGHNKPERPNSSPAAGLPYPNDQEE
ncbi:competence protein ComEC [Desulfosarcina sp. OttesenSCG-928-A07]|nr:competence protein ComEC [Desulfosarcina sp. OttesenSCG-928-A07]